jgi:hypothetical protein
MLCLVMPCLIVSCRFMFLGIGHAIVKHDVRSSLAMFKLFMPFHIFSHVMFDHVMSCLQVLIA